MSPSMRREWIEIRWSNDIINGIESPSMRREWIEMSSVCNALPFPTSPSMRREWIEIAASRDANSSIVVSLHAEGVD